MMPTKGDSLRIRCGQPGSGDDVQFVLEQKAPPCAGAPQTEAASGGLSGVQGNAPATLFSAVQKKPSVFGLFFSFTTYSWRLA
jgi:hypothetical protein